MILVVRVLLTVGLLLEAVAIAASGLLLSDARRDLRAVTAARIANGRGIVARTSVRTETLRLLSLLFLAASSVSSAVVLWDAPERVATPSLIVAFVTFDLAAAAILAGSLEVYSMRRRLFDRYEATTRHDRRHGGDLHPYDPDTPPQE